MTGPRLRRPRSLRAEFEAALTDAATEHPLGPPRPNLAPADLVELPDPIRRYVVRSGALGRPRPQNMRVVLDAAMYRAPGTAPMTARSVQYTAFARPTRVFLMHARMFGLPVRALHVYAHEQARFTVRVASLVTMVDLRGEQISAAETVTVLNDICLMAPAALVDPRLAWEHVDDATARVTFTNGPHRVTATLAVDDDDELVGFWSDDRPDASTGTFAPMRWSTPVTGYADADGRHLPHRGRAVYDRPDGPFTYGEVTIRSVDYDVAWPAPGVRSA